MLIDKSHNPGRLVRAFCPRVAPRPVASVGTDFGNMLEALARASQAPSRPPPSWPAALREGQRVKLKDSIRTPRYGMGDVCILGRTGNVWRVDFSTGKVRKWHSISGL